MITCKNISELPLAATELIAAIGNKKMVCFYGQMGAGKTTLIKEICNKLGVKDNVASPTFSLVNEYKDSSGNSIFHFDFYRIKKMEEVYDIGYQDYFYSGELCLVEWPEMVKELIPAGAVNIYITVTGEQRVFEVR